MVRGLNVVPTGYHNPYVKLHGVFDLLAQRMFSESHEIFSNNINTNLVKITRELFAPKGQKKRFWVIRESLKSPDNIQASLHEQKVHVIDEN